MFQHLSHYRVQGGHDSLMKSPPPKLMDGAIAPARADWSLRFGRCEVRVAHREVLVDGKVRALQPRPFDLLVYLIENRERVVTADELLDRVWRNEVVQPGSLTAAIMRVRKAVCENEPGIGQVIRTYQRVGYRFVGAVEDSALVR